MGKSKYLVIGTGVVVGLAALILTAAGNPANMGFCIACFLREDVYKRQSMRSASQDAA